MKSERPSDMLGRLRFWSDAMGYFKPLRRKIGVVTLVVACLFAAGWVRSLNHPDLFAIRGKALTANQLVSSNGTVSWESISWNKTEKISPEDFNFFYVPILKKKEKEKDNQFSRSRHWSLYGFEWGEYYSPAIDKTSDLKYVKRKVPYWSIVIPLTLLSAWLLLSKPRERNAAKVQAAEIST